jgi:hypothetical protein
VCISLVDSEGQLAMVVMLLCEAAAVLVSVRMCAMYGRSSSCPASHRCMLALQWLRSMSWVLRGEAAGVLPYNQWHVEIASAAFLCGVAEFSERPQHELGLVGDPLQR